MTDGRFLSGGRAGGVGFNDDEAGSLASTVLSVVAHRRVPARGELDAALLAGLTEAVLSNVSEDHREALAALLAARVPHATISERYIPEAARRLGDYWCGDRVSFGDVTIASSRLQSMLRELDGPGHAYRESFQAPLALVVVPAGEFHTLGAMVMVGQLRRRGVSVRLSAGLPTPELLDLVEAQSYDVILVSWSNRHTLDSLRKLVVSIRLCMDREAPIVVGGQNLGSLIDVKAQTGADHASSDIDEALRLCGMMVCADGVRRYQMMG